MKRRYTRTQKKQILNFRTYGALISGVVIAIGALIGLLFFVRPSESELEGRELSEFPSFTVTTFLDGTYFEDVAVWYGDTYPMREAFVKADRGMKSLCGVGGGAEAEISTDADAQTREEPVNKEDKAEDNAPGSIPTDITTEDPEIGLIK